MWLLMSLLPSYLPGAGTLGSEQAAAWFDQVNDNHPDLRCGWQQLIHVLRHHMGFDTSSSSEHIECQHTAADSSRERHASAE